MTQYLVSFIYDRSSESLIARATTIEKWLKNIGITQKPKHVDMHESLTHTDINIHIDVPVYSAISWAFSNILIKDATTWLDAYEAYEPAFDVIIEWQNITHDQNLVQPLQIAMEKIVSIKPKHGNHICPPILTIDDCPPISIITPTFNRRKLLQIACHNMLVTDYPMDRMEWIIIEDAEKQEDMASDVIVNFQVNNPLLKVKYIPLSGRHTIGHKRNIGVENATADIILFMDDDDHYPTTSFRRRVAWLTKNSRRSISIVCCTTIALYDLRTGQSAVNVPPFSIPLSRRVSEATFTFHKSVWNARKFEDKSVSEGEEWISGREYQVAEIPPQQIIVAFNHQENQSRRTVPADAPVGCFWGFPKEYLQFIHGLVGIDVEDSGVNSNKGNKKPVISHS